MHGLIAASIRRKRHNFFASYKGGATSGAEKKKTEKRKGEEKSEQGEKSLPYPIVDGEHNGAGNPSIDATVFVLMQNGSIYGIIKNYNQTMQ